MAAYTPPRNGADRRQTPSFLTNERAFVLRDTARLDGFPMEVLGMTTADALARRAEKEVDYAVNFGLPDGGRGMPPRSPSCPDCLWRYVARKLHARRTRHSALLCVVSQNERF